MGNNNNFIKNYDLETPVPVIVEELSMTGYHEDREGQIVHVWVNPSRMLLDDWIHIQAESDKLVNRLAKTINGKSEAHVVKYRGRALAKLKKLADANNLLQYAWYSKIWSQGDDAATHVTPEDVQRLAEGSAKKGEIAIWKWVTNQTQALIIGHFEGLEKNSKAP